MENKALLFSAIVLLAHSAASGQSALRLIAIDGDAAPSFLGSMIDIQLNDQSSAAGLPQLAPDGGVSFRARVVSVIGGPTAGDSWWVSRPDGNLCVAHNAGNQGISFIPTGQFGRLFLHDDDSRIVVDRSGNRLHSWLDQRWVALSTTPNQVRLDGVPWLPTSLDRTSVLMPAPARIVFTGLVPPPPGSQTAGPGPGFVTGWGLNYTSFLATGQPVPGLANTFFNVPDPMGATSTDGPLGRTLRMNGAGQWVARVGLAGAGAGSNNQAIYRGTVGSAPQAVIRLNDPAPGWSAAQGATVIGLSRPSINSAGHIAFTARTRTTSPASSSFFSLYVDRGAGAGLELLARTGTALVPIVPDGPPPSINAPVNGVGNIVLPPALGEDGTVAFAAATNFSPGAVLVWRDGQVFEASRLGTPVPGSAGRLTYRIFSGTDPFTDIDLPLAVSPTGDVVFAIPTNGTYDPRMAVPPLNGRTSVVCWRAGRGSRLVVGAGSSLEPRPSMHAKVFSASILGGGGPGEGVPTCAGTPGGAAVQLEVARFITDSGPAFQAVVLADLNTDACGIVDTAGPGAQPGADGSLDNNDFILMIDRFFAGDLRADYGKAGGVIGFDDRLDNNDFVAFITLFFAGCE